MHVYDKNCILQNIKLLMKSKTVCVHHEHGCKLKVSPASIRTDDQAKFGRDHSIDRKVSVPIRPKLLLQFVITNRASARFVVLRSRPDPRFLLTCPSSSQRFHHLWIIAYFFGNISSFLLAFLLALPFTNSLTAMLKFIAQ